MLESLKNDTQGYMCAVVSPRARMIISRPLKSIAPRRDVGKALADGELDSPAL